MTHAIEEHNDRHQFRLGVTKSLPIVLGVVPFGLAYGVLAVQGGLTIAETMLMSLIVFAGASQFMAAGMFASGVGGLTIVLSTLLINLRHLVMGLSISPYLSETSPAWQRLVAFGMVDESYMISITHYREQGTPQGSPHFLLASGVTMYVMWFCSSLIGAVAGHSISDPLSWGLDFAMPATFLTMLLPQMMSRRLLAVVGLAAAASLAAFLLIPGKWYIIIAVVVGTAAGVALESRDEARAAA